jgi:hypothetical protein
MAFSILQFDAPSFRAAMTTPAREKLLHLGELRKRLEKISLPHDHEKGVVCIGFKLLPLRGHGND